MAEITLVAEAGREHGSAASRRLRAAGRIPAVVYGHGIEPVPISVDARELRGALGTEAGMNALLRLEIGSDHHLALAREIQRHPVRHVVTHVDFQVVSRDQVVSYDLNISLVGEASTVQRADGIVDQELFTVPVKSKPGDVPPYVEVDVSGLEIGDVIRVADLKLPAGVEIDLDPDSVIVVAHPPRGRGLEEGEGVEGEGAEGAAEGSEAAEAAGGAGEGAGGESS